MAEIISGCAVCWGSGYDMQGRPCPFASQHRVDADRAMGRAPLAETAQQAQGEARRPGPAKQDAPMLNMDGKPDNMDGAFHD